MSTPRDSTPATAISSSSSDTQCTAVESGSDNDMIQEAKTKVKAVADNANLHTEHVGDCLFVGNTHGLSYAKRSKDSDRLQSAVDFLKNEISQVKSRTAILEEQVITLQESLGHYQILRARFIATFKRDKLGNATPADLRAIAEGSVNGWAHAGNASRDADMYVTVGGRNDVDIYEILYGLHPSIVKSITYLPTLSAVNKHATVRASSRMTGPPRFYELFTKFLEALRASAYAADYLEDGKLTNVTTAYCSFMRREKDEVTAV